MLSLEHDPKAIRVYLQDKLIFLWTDAKPSVFAGKPAISFALFKGRFKIRDKSRRKPLHPIFIHREQDRIELGFAKQGDTKNTAVKLEFSEIDGLVCLEISAAQPDLTLDLRLPMKPDEKIFGCGEHFSAFNLRGKKVKIWVEEHIGTLETAAKILKLMLGIKPKLMPFSRYSTYHPQPTFISSCKYFVHLDSDAYSLLDFTAPDYAVIRITKLPARVYLGRGQTHAEITERLTELIGRPPVLPSWLFDGIILGIQDGTERCAQKTAIMRKAGAAVCGIWAQDWEGQRITYFGKQLRWDYRADSRLYPELAARIAEWKQAGIRFLGYINPYLCDDGQLFKEAKARGYLALKPDGTMYLTKATSFPFGIVDLTNPEAFAWYKSIIAKNMIEIGMAGWMADFGEYLPADALLKGGSGRDFHNRWPVLWAKLNREAVEEAGKSGEICFFTRAGFTGTSRYSTLAWNGDQHVDWSDDYGIGSVVRASLSLGLSGMPQVHSDVGGYTTLPKMVRSKELFLRWLEMSAFSPVLRTHEGNRPEANWQFDSDEETIAAVSRFSRIHANLKPYLLAAAQEAAARGIPFMRPLFYHYDGDFGDDEDKAYLLGRDLAVYPVLKPNAKSRKLILPKDNWIYLWDGTGYAGGAAEVSAPLGIIPVFYRSNSEYRKLFEELKDIR